MKKIYNTPQTSVYKIESDNTMIGISTTDASSTYNGGGGGNNDSKIGGIESFDDSENEE